MNKKFSFNKTNESIIIVLPHENLVQNESIAQGMVLNQERIEQFLAKDP